MSLQPRDEQIMVALLCHRVLTLDQVMACLSTPHRHQSREAVRQRLNLLAANGWVAKSERSVDNQLRFRPTVKTAQRHSWPQPATDDKLALLDHTWRAAEIALDYERQGHQVVTETQMQRSDQWAIDQPLVSGEAVPFAIPVPGKVRPHFPDLCVVARPGPAGADHYLTAVEVQLSRRAVDYFATLLVAYAAAPTVKAVRYCCLGPQAEEIAIAVTRAVHQTNTGHLVEIWIDRSVGANPPVNLQRFVPPAHVLNSLNRRRRPAASPRPLARGRSPRR
jgi:hypothetical protein